MKKRKKKKTCYSRFFLLFANDFVYNMHPYKSSFFFFFLNHSTVFICIWKETNCMQIFVFIFFFALVLALNPLYVLKSWIIFLLGYCVLVIYFEYLFIFRFSFYLQLLQSCFIVLYKYYTFIQCFWSALRVEKVYMIPGKSIKNTYKNRKRFYVYNTKVKLILKWNFFFTLLFGGNCVINTN